MSSRDFGDSYGYDEINPYDEIPITFEQVQLNSGRPMLLSRNEYPRLDAGLPTGQMDAVTQKNISRRVTAPLGMIEGFGTQYAPFSQGINLSSEDIQVIILFLLVVVVCMQMRIMMQWENGHNGHNGHTVPILLGHGITHQAHLAH